MRKKGASTDAPVITIKADSLNPIAYAHYGTYASMGYLRPTLLDAMSY